MIYWYLLNILFGYMCHETVVKMKNDLKLIFLVYYIMCSYFQSVTYDCRLFDILCLIIEFNETKNKIYFNYFYHVTD